MKKFVIVIPSYKNAGWYGRNLNSVFAQDYENFRIIYTDDCSPDGTGNLVESYIQKYGQSKPITLIKNTTRIGAMENLYNMIHSCDDDEIIVTLDGDDHLAHSKVLQRLNEYYSNNDIWVAWSNYMDSHGRPGCSRAIPPEIIKANGYRNYHWCSSHIRTFYSWLFKRIKREDFLQSDGKFYQMAWDVAFMTCLIEMAAERSMFINEILYAYNTQNPINDDKVNRDLQIKLEREIRAKPKYHKILNK